MSPCDRAATAIFAVSTLVLYPVAAPLTLVVSDGGPTKRLSRALVWWYAWAARKGAQTTIAGMENKGVILWWNRAVQALYR